MITIDKADRCCGCGACTEVCAHNAISMSADEEGFLYPKVDANACVDCGLCERVCPFLNGGNERTPKRTIAASNGNEKVRRRSSSGGLFYLLAEATIAEGGVVVGARFADDCSVVHDVAETIDDCIPFMGSKYVQSRLGDIFQRVRTYLNAGRKVLFSGTPCQVSALHRFLRRDYDNLLLVDVVCHGVPSNEVWQRYLDEVVERVSSKRSDIDSISFRDKRNGWRNYGLQILFKDGKELFVPFRENPFMQLFLKDLSIRPSCYECRCRGGRSGADISLADFWGVDKVLHCNDDNMGTSLIIVWSNRGDEFISCLDVGGNTAPYYKVVKYNPAIAISPRVPYLRTTFWRNFAESGVENSAYLAKQVKWTRLQKWSFSLRKHFILTKLKLK